MYQAYNWTKCNWTKSQKELEEASSTTEKEQINHKFDKEKLASQDKFLEEMKTAIEELPKTFGETVVKAVETDSKQREKIV